MTDALAQIDLAARDLLDRVDAILVRFGAPDEHPIWGELRDLGALPIDVYEFLAGWNPDAISPTGAALNHIREGLRYQYTTLADAAGLAAEAWSGRAADAFSARWQSYAARIAGDEGTLDGGVEATQVYLTAVADWAKRWRAELAYAVLACLTSAEAVALHDATEAISASAAATIGARILRVGADAIRDGDQILSQWRAVLSA